MSRYQNKNNDDKSLTLKQPRLIKIIIEIIGVKDANPKSTLVVKPLLSNNADGKNRKITACTVRWQHDDCNAWQDAQDLTCQWLLIRQQSSLIIQKTLMMS